VVLLPAVLVFTAGQVVADPAKADMLTNLPQVALPAGLNEEQAIL